MTDYIKREDAIKAITWQHDEFLSVDGAIEDLEGVPSADVVERKKGKWLHKKITADFHAIGQCSVCKEIRRIDNFCPNCGAEMKQE